MNNLNIVSVNKSVYGDDYQKHILEQYKIYVEMADRVSARRMQVNSFFVGVNTAIITALTVLLKEHILPQTVFGAIPFLATMLLCFLWWRIVTSYRQLNSGKFTVIHEIEKYLPINPYDAEWIVLQRGENKKTYLPITHVENLIPICFGILYILLVVAYFFK